MDAYTIAKMSIEELTSYFSDSLIESARELAEKCKVELKEVRRKQTVCSLTSLAMLIIPVAIIFALSEKISESVMPILVMGGGVLTLIGFVLLFITMGHARNASLLQTKSDPRYHVDILARAARAQAVEQVLAENWLCPYCGAPNPKTRQTDCERCGKPYNGKLSDKQANNARRMGGIPSTRG